MDHGLHEDGLSETKTKNLVALHGFPMTYIWKLKNWLMKWVF